MTVPEFHNEDNGRSIRLGVVRLKSSSESPAAPLFLAAGGPGGSLLENAAVVADPASEPDSGCIAESEPLPFILPAEVPSGAAASP